MTWRPILLAGVALIGLGGCSSTQSSASKEEQARYGDRNPKDIHVPPAGFGPGAGGHGGAPPGSQGPPKGAQTGPQKGA